MATRSYIGYKTKQGKFKGVYVHSDGYPSGVGKTLYTGYKSVKKFEELLALGDLSVLGFSPGKEKVDFDKGVLTNLFKSSAFINKMKEAKVELAKMNSKTKGLAQAKKLVDKFISGTFTDKDVDKYGDSSDGYRLIEDWLEKNAEKGMYRKFLFTKDFGKTKSYSRDRGEKDLEVRTFNSLKAFYEAGYNSDAEWIYLGMPDDAGKLTWYVTKVKSKAVPQMKKWVPVRSAISYKRDPEVKIESEALEMLEEGFNPDIRSFEEYLEEAEIILMEEDGKEVSLSEIKKNVMTGIREGQIKANSPLYPYAKAFVAMSDDPKGMYGSDSNKSVALYFLSNGSHWKGEVAKQTKAMIKKVFGVK